MKTPKKILSKAFDIAADIIGGVLLFAASYKLAVFLLAA